MRAHTLPSSTHVAIQLASPEPPGSSLPVLQDLFQSDGGKLLGSLRQPWSPWSPWYRNTPTLGHSWSSEDVGNIYHMDPHGAYGFDFTEVDFAVFRSIITSHTSPRYLVGQEANKGSYVFIRFKTHPSNSRSSTSREVMNDSRLTRRLLPTLGLRHRLPVPGCGLWRNGKG